MKYIILGQSVTAIKFIEQLRARDQEAEVSVIGFDVHLPALPERFLELISRQINRKDVLYQDENFYRNLRVEFISDRKIQRINFKRKIVFFDDKTQLSGDVIILAGTEKDVFSEIKGTNKEGVLSLRTYGQIEQLLVMIHRSDTVFLESETLWGALLAQVLVKQDKEVIFCIPSGRIWPSVFDEVASDFMISLMEQLGIRIIRKGQIREILGENDVKAVRLNVDKVISSEVVLFPDALPDIRIYTAAGLEAQERIQVDALLRTNFEGVFAVDDLARGFVPEMQYCQPDVFRQDQAARLIAAVEHRDYEMESGIDCEFHFDLCGHTILVLGDFLVPEAKIFVKYNENGFLNKRILIKNNTVYGAILVDNINMGQRLQELIQNKEVIDISQHECLSDCVRENKTEESSFFLQKQ